MKSKNNLSRLACPLRGAGFALAMAAAPLAHATDVWTGPAITYTQPAAYNPADLSTVDQITGDVWFTRGSGKPPFNAAPPYNETSYNGSTSPENTEWAFGDISQHASLTYDTWANVIGGEQGGDLSTSLPNRPLVMHIITDDIYLSIEFTSWTHGGFGFTYQRSTSGASTPAPTVNITSPSGGATFTAPASVPIQASASVSSGTVTNVAFFAATNNVTHLLGSAQTAPFNFTALNLAAGNYALTAVATAAGVSATSAVVNITVNPPAPTVTITNPSGGATFTAPASVPIQASASVSSGTVTNVAFFAGTNNVTHLLGSVQSSPFNFTALNLAAGNYSLTAVATAAGISVTSPVVNITVNPPAPTVTITNPSGGATFTAPASVLIQASASVSSGTVTNVAFFAGTNNVTNLLGSVQSSPFNFTALNLAAGNYSLIAVATAAGISVTSPVVNITVNPPAPTVSITNPVAGAVFSAPANLRLEATAAVSSGTVTNVAFFATNAATTNSLGSAQSSPFNITSSSLAAGNYSLLAVAMAAGISATSAVVNVSIVSPVTVSNSIPAVAAGQFSFDYSADVGLTYVILKSSDLSTWVPVVTNAATSNPAHFSESAVGSGARYYQVVLQPNP